MNRFRSAVLIVASLPAWQCTSAAQSAGARLFRGHLVIGEGVEVFTPCGTDEALWLDAERVLYDRLRAEPMGFSPVPYDYEGTYAELEGEIGPQLDCGFCEDYEGSFRVTKILSHRPASDEDCR